jgi:hypothetical protein
MGREMFWYSAQDSLETLLVGRPRAFGRPGNRQALHRAYQYLELSPKAVTRRAVNSR